MEAGWTAHMGGCVRQARLTKNPWAPFFSLELRYYLGDLYGAGRRPAVVRRRGYIQGWPVRPHSG